MAENSKIEWTDHTANFWWGCFKVSPGCKHCYADTWATRWGKDIWGPAATTSREMKKGVWADVRKWNKLAQDDGVRRRVFCMSMGDFYEDHPQLTEVRGRALKLIEKSTALDWQLLTKRPENVMQMVPERWHNDWPAHVWIGTSVENQEQADKRIPGLLKIPAAVRFLSMEPLLGAVDLTTGGYFEKGWTGRALNGIDWVIVGGESGPNARPMHPDWVRSIRDQCNTAGVSFFFKQWGVWSANGQRVGKKSAGRLLDGREWNELPTTEVSK